MSKIILRHKRRFPLLLAGFLVLEAENPLNTDYVVFFNQGAVIVNTSVFESIGAAQTSPIKLKNWEKRIQGWIKEQETKLHYQKC